MTADNDQKPETGDPDPKPNEDPQPGTGSDPQPQDLDGLRTALAKEREDRRRFEKEAKASRDAVRRLQEIEDADKTEGQKAAERAAKAEKDAADSVLRADRLEVALAKGLTAGQAKRLVGNTREELEKDADELVAELKGTPKPVSSPKEDLRGGGEPEDQPTEMDPRKLAEGISRY